MSNKEHEVFNKEKLNTIFKKYSINPKKYSRYQTALTHSSYKNEHNLNNDYERYEFLGDSAVSWVITNYLFDKENLAEGEMSIIKAKLVSTKSLAKATRMLGLDELILLGNGMKNKALTDKVLEDVFEAFIGAVAKDVGIKKAQLIIKDTVIKMYNHGEINTSKPYKTLIQEYLGRSENKEIRYIPLNEKNETPRRVRLEFNGITYAEGFGNTLKEAEENAAFNCYSLVANKQHH
ncbi:ribonuclease III [Ureaplasma ceti]|uniref:Ribonuclease 3 n=1 Tax=Ureaplasma ceti TaxID=3119530 RepID=A0ABP9U990_9BACT